VDRLDVTPSSWPATAAFPKPGPIAEATSHIVDPSVISSTMPSGKVTLTWDILLTPHCTLKTPFVFLKKYRVVPGRSQTNSYDIIKFTIPVWK
jgi:hypothetical protein